MSKYLDFVLIRKTEKTQVYDVISRSHAVRLALIKWYGPWRQYVLEPEPETVWNKDCLNDVSAFLWRLMQLRAPKEEHVKCDFCEGCGKVQMGGSDNEWEETCPACNGRGSLTKAARAELPA